MKATTFQLVVSALFILFIVIGVATFAMFTTGGGGAVGKVIMWGTVDREVMDDWFTAMTESGDKALADVEYTQIPAASYESTVTNAIAAGRGPDLFVVTDSNLLFFADKILEIPYSSYSQSEFTRSFVDEAPLFLTTNGVRALPIMIDPLVLYWNRDILSAAGIANPPQYWNDLLSLAPQITQVDSSQQITRSAAALGTWRNVVNAKSILAALMIQAGEKIVTTDNEGRPISTLGTEGGSESPAASALRFYTEFANPGKTTYSWSGAKENSTNAFLAGEVGMYVGFASEYRTLRERNPNLRFDVALVPQLRSGITTTVGRLAGLAVSRGAQNPQGALAAAAHLSSQVTQRLLPGVTGLPSVRRDITIDTSGNAAAEVFTQSALIARGWLDPGAAGSDVVFKDMIESVLSGKNDPSIAVSQAAEGLNALLHPSEL